MNEATDPAALLESTVYLLSAVARSGKHALDGRLAERGLRLRHMAVLAAVADGGATSQLALGRHVRLDASDVTTVVDDLQQRGLVDRMVDPRDRRRRLVRLTAAGTAELSTLGRIAEQVAADLLAPLPGARRRQLHDDLLVVLAGLRGPDGTPGPG